MSIQTSISSLESASGWTKVIGPTINPVAPDGYEFVQLPDGLRLYCCGPAYGGWLAKFVSPLFYPFKNISFHYRLMTDDATASSAQIIETDTKFTDADGYTYDGSCQWNIAEGWMFQVDNSSGGWVDTGIKIPPMLPNQWTDVTINYVLDYVNHTISVVSVWVDGNKNTVPSSFYNLPAKKEGWAPNEIVTQLQQCNNGNRGGHSQKFSQIGYTLSE